MVALSMNNRESRSNKGSTSVQTNHLLDSVDGGSTKESTAGLQSRQSLPGHSYYLSDLSDAGKAAPTVTLSDASAMDPDAGSSLVTVGPELSGTWTANDNAAGEVKPLEALLQGEASEAQSHLLLEARRPRVAFSSPRESNEGPQENPPSAHSSLSIPVARAVSCHGCLDPEAPGKQAAPRPPRPPPPYRATDSGVVPSRGGHRASFGKVITSPRKVRPLSGTQQRGGLWALLENLQARKGLEMDR